MFSTARGVPEGRKKGGEVLKTDKRIKLGLDGMLLSDGERVPQLLI